MAVDLDALQARLRATADALRQQPVAPPTTPQVVVEVTKMPRPSRWVFTVARNDAGQISAIVAEAEE